MARTDEASSFFHAVYSAIQEIPYGRVTSYGHIALLIGTHSPTPTSNQDPDQDPDATTTPQQPRFHSANVPWQRVINSKGVISPRGHHHPSGAANQAQVLRGEGVAVTAGSMGELSVDLAVYGWFPRQLPSEAAAGMVPHGDSEEDEDEGGQDLPTS
ncbi:uncharacterized protein L3040_000486 [Drepanopeziza brunnea f. sp. 'multigermtubi']|uniref:uncharacterized protein n=1 Tax=Drepanopeziza brunnea f. sp. 'multigermtubi' TaxID=698441 RepID=UPI0023921A95|nr:hypothetical protein L3040_000486 [Drepanopeziza brunnea f. sp. 'multigermtubi']